MTSTPPIGNVPEELHELYAAYCEFKNDATRALLRDEQDPEGREYIKRTNHPMTKVQFVQRLEFLDPKKRENVKGKRQRK